VFNELFDFCSGHMQSWTPVKSNSDEREYRVVELENKLQCLLISDKTTDKAGAAMDVGVGNFCDPDQLAGLAHFLEHMLFLGTEKYPDENAYSAFLAEHGGKSNAFTSIENTNYYFDVAQEHLESMLDRFAQFCISPLFTSSATDREMNAVNNENVKNLLDDQWRSFQLMKATSNTSHPYSKFGTGNLETLLEMPTKAGIDTRSELLRFYAAHYSANISKLVIYGKEPLDVLERWANAKFSAVVNKNLQPKAFGEDAFGKQGKMYKIVPIKDMRNLILSWCLPPTRQHYRTKPTSVLGHLLGHEGQGSILELLKARNWGNELSAGVNLGSSCFTVFGISIDLSEEGLNHIEEIIAIVYQYLWLISQVNDAELVKICEEVRDVSQMNFQFKSKEQPFNYCSSLAANLHLYSPEEILTGPFLYKEMDLGLVRSLVGRMLGPELRVDVLSPSFKRLADCKERWYETEYSVSPFSESLQRKLENPEPSREIWLPLKNEFIATDFTVKSTPIPPSLSPASPVLLPVEGIKCWWKLDDIFCMPKANVLIKLVMPLAYVSPRTAQLNALFASLVEDSLNAYAYDAAVAGLGYSLSASSTGLNLQFRGYNHKLSILARRVLESVRNLEVKEDRMQQLKEQQSRSLANFFKEPPYQQAIYAQLQSSEYLWHHLEKRQALESIGPADLRRYIDAVFTEGGDVTLFVHGNMDQKDALEMATLTRDTLRLGSLFASQLPGRRIVKLDPGHTYQMRNRVLNATDKNSATLLTFQVGEATVDLQAQAELLCHILNEPCFNVLRTQEQLGYLVFSGAQNQTGVLSLRVIVQSSEWSAAYLHSRVEAFLYHDFHQLLLTMPRDVFGKNKDAVLALLEEKDKRLDQETMRHWDEISSGRLHFNRRAAVVEVVRTLELGDVLKFFLNFMALNGPRRLTSIQYFGAAHTVPKDGFCEQLMCWHRNPCPSHPSEPVVLPSSAPPTQTNTSDEEEGDEGEEERAPNAVKAPSLKKDLKHAPADHSKTIQIMDLEYEAFRRTMPLYPSYP
jgi:insulysin